MNQFMSGACRFMGQPDSQKNAVIVYFFSGLLMVMLMLFPVRKYYESNKDIYLEQINIKNWTSSNLKNKSNNYTDKKSSKNNSKLASDISLFSLISETSKKGMISRIEQRGSTVVVSIEKSRLSSLLSWLSEISDQYQVEVQNTSIVYLLNDTVSAQITFSQ